MDLDIKQIYITIFNTFVFLAHIFTGISTLSCFNILNLLFL